MINRAAYDASQIDWDRLKRYARRVAREAKCSFGPPVKYSNQVSNDAPVERQTRGFLGFGARTDVCEG
jgi:hypothetical protein